MAQWCTIVPPTSATTPILTGTHFDRWLAGGRPRQSCLVTSGELPLWPLALVPGPQQPGSMTACWWCPVPAAEMAEELGFTRIVIACWRIQPGSGGTLN